MRILLDKNLNWRLRRDLPGHEVESVPLIGWSGIQNGELLKKAVEAGFQLLVTMDGTCCTGKTLLDIGLPSRLCGPYQIGWKIRGP